MAKIVLIIHDVRSTHNVGAMLRTADGLGIGQVILSGYTPYPLSDNDDRLPHLAAKLNRQIRKTALGAEKSVSWQHCSNVREVIDDLRQSGYRIAALEQASDSKPLQEYRAPDMLALIVGSEVEGLSSDILKDVDETLEIPMSGAKESFNVASAAAIALYHLKYF